MAVQYDKNVDYQALINKAIAAGDYKAAGQYEQQRNAKIAGEGITDYQQTHNLGSVFDQTHFTNEELGAAYRARSAADGSGTDMGSAHSYVENVRKKYGYSGGEDGSAYIALPGGAGTGGFTYASAPSYTDRYQARIDELLGGILSRDKFSYDAAQDPLYRQYKDQYLQQGQRAMQDTLGQMSARTGGLASSWAETAAQQQQNYYAGQAAEKIPELYQLAYQMYLDDIDGQVRDLGLLQQMSDTQYGRYRDTMADWRDDRDFAYGRYRDDVADARYDQEFAYQAGRDQLADQRYSQEYADSRGDTQWQRLNYASEAEYDRALQKAQTLAAAGDFSGYEALGYSAAETAGLKRAYERAQTALASAGSGGAAGAQDKGILAAMFASGSDAAAYEYLLGQDLAAGKTDTLWELYRSGGQMRSQAYDSVLETARTLTPEEADAYLGEMADKGYITEEELRYIFEVELNLDAAALLAALGGAGFDPSAVRRPYLSGGGGGPKSGVTYLTPY